MKMLKKLPDEMAEEEALVLSAFSLRCKYYHLLFLEYLYRNIAICCLWQPSFGLKIPTEYPLAILFASSQMIAFCTFALKLPISENLLLPFLYFQAFSMTWSPSFALLAHALSRHMAFPGQARASARLERFQIRSSPLV